MAQAKAMKSNATTKTLEQRLCDAADALRGGQKCGEHKHVVQGLLSAKCVPGRVREWHS